MALNTQSPRSILHIITRLDKGGSADMLLDLARIQAENGSRVAIALGKTVDPQCDLEQYALQTGVIIFHIPSLLRSPSPLNDLRAFVALLRIVRRFSPDIAHTHTSKAGIVGRGAAYFAGVRKIVHTPHGHIFYGYYSPAVTKLFILLERLFARISGKITVLTQKGLSDHVAEKIGKAALFSVIPSGVNLERFIAGNGDAIRSSLAYGEETIVGWVGRLVAIKNCSSFLKAVTIVHEQKPSIRFLIAGDGDERSELEKKAAEYNLKECLVFLGNRSDIPDIMAAMDIFVLSSLNEGFGRVLVEAMAAGTAIVTTDVGGTSDVIEDTVSGILVPPSDPEALASAILSLISDKKLREKYSREGRKRAVQFDVHHTAQCFEDVYDELFEK